MYKTTRAFHKQLQYSQRKNGWRVEFHGAFDVIVEAPTIDECRSQADEVFDEKVAALVVARPRSRIARSR